MTTSPPSSASNIFEAVSRRPDGVLLRVRLTPKSASDGIIGLDKRPDGNVSLRINLRALPEKGRANKALEALLAKSLGVAKRNVRVVSGAKSRYKSVKVTGDPAALIPRTALLLGEARQTGKG